MLFSPEERFDLEDLRNLEHMVEGRFDEQGVFHGKVRAFGHDLGTVSLPPARPPGQGRSERVGELGIRVVRRTNIVTKRVVKTGKPAARTTLRIVRES